MSQFNSVQSVAIVGSAGVPGNYGGFETLAENLVKFYSQENKPYKLIVYCSSKQYEEEQSSYLSCELKYTNLSANGASSILYDWISLFKAIRAGCEVVLLLGVSGALCLPLLRLFTNLRIIVNIDGLEWKRDKWSSGVKHFLKYSEKIAVKYSNSVVADNEAIREYISNEYGLASQVIAYGGDHVFDVPANHEFDATVFGDFAFAVCRIEPENNIHLMLAAFVKAESKYNFVIVGNWAASSYGRNLKLKYHSESGISLLNPIYDLGTLRVLRSSAVFIIHGHSAGGTNPALVEAMQFDTAVVAYDCTYNRHTTENRALFFSDEDELVKIITNFNHSVGNVVAKNMNEIASRRYTWAVVANDYFSLIEK